MTALPQSPFQRLLGAAFDGLPAPVRAVHGRSATLATTGRAEVTTAPGALPWLICRIAGLPRPGTDIPTTVVFQPDGRGRERWRRRFGRRRYSSMLGLCETRHGTMIRERLGLFALFFRLTPRGDGLAWSLAAWQFAGLPLPAWSVPAVACLESGDGDRFVFDIDAAFPFVGPVIHYRGWLIPEQPEAGRSA